jgi:gliding motility-associated-like protein
LTAVINTAVFPSPDPLFTFEPDHGCTPLEVVFGLKNAGNTVSADWTFGDGSTGTGLTDITHIYIFPGTISVGTHVVDANGCVADTVLHHIIRVYPPPTALFHYTPLPELTTENTHLEFTAFQPELESYQWTLGQVQRMGQEVSYDFPYGWAGSYSVCLTVTDSIACTATLCDTIVIHDPLAVYVPNTFTPDGDGVNDVWKPSLVSADPKDLSMEVYDRWGQVVFASESPDMGWNGGQGNSGSVLPQGIYSWRLQLRNIFTAESKEYFGHVSLLK